MLPAVDGLSTLIEPGVDDVFQPARLRLARELLGMSQAQLKDRAGLSAAAISQFESGVTRPSVAALAQLAEALSTPTNFFMMPVTGTHEGFFRSLRRSSAADRRRARAFAQLVHDVAVDEGPRQLPAVDIPRLAVTDLQTDEREVAKAAISVRRRWQVPPGPVTNVVDLLEAHGVLVVRLPLGSADVDAFSLPFEDRPVVVLGTEKSDRARSRFDAAHELGHLVMHGEAVWGVKPIEDQAHAFAAEFLMPATDIGKSLPARASWPELFALKQHWHVSLAALLRRARDLGQMTDSAYLAGIKAASARGWRKAEPVPLGSPEEPKVTTSLLKRNAGVATQWLPSAMQERIGTTSQAYPKLSL